MERTPSAFICRRYQHLINGYRQAWKVPHVRSHRQAVMFAIANTEVPISACISPFEASRCIGKILRGASVDDTRDRKKDIVKIVYSEYCRLHDMSMFKDNTIYFTVAFASRKTVRGLHMSYERARRIITNIQKGRYEEYGIIW